VKIKKTLHADDGRSAVSLTISLDTSDLTPDESRRVMSEILRNTAKGLTDLPYCNFAIDNTVVLPFRKTNPVR
jgi:hypothetical protein